MDGVCMDSVSLETIWCVPGKHMVCAGKVCILGRNTRKKDGVHGLYVHVKQMFVCLDVLSVVCVEKRWQVYGRQMKLTWMVCA